MNKSNGNSRRNGWAIAQRVTAIFFSWSALGIAIYGLFAWRFDLWVMAALWYFIGGGLIMQNLRDAEEEFGDNN